MTNYEMQLPNTVSTFRLLDGARLTGHDQTLTLGSNLELETMKSALKRYLYKVHFCS